MKEPPAEEYGEALEPLAMQLMSAAKRGDAVAFESLARVLRPRAFTLARSLVGSPEDALELTQEAFLKTYAARATYREGEPCLPWFTRILRNTCYSFLRKRNRLRPHSLSARAPGAEDEGDWLIEDDGELPSDALERSESTALFWRAFARLSAREREILGLRHFRELSYKEIAHTLGIPEGTVMSRLFHARAHLRRILAPHWEEGSAP